MSGNHIGDAGVAALAEALIHNQKITKISLVGNNISDALKRTLIRDNRLLF